MSELLEITLMVAVYFPPGEPGRIRQSGFRESLRSWQANLYYEGDLSLLVVNDGPALADWPEWQGPQRALGHPRGGLGASFNLGFRDALARSPLAANIVDDWMLVQPFDLTPWALLLMEYEKAGAVRLLAPYPGTTGTIHPLPHGWAVILNRHNLAGGLRPTLYHRRFFDAYGWFDEACSSWECERMFNERFCQSTGPESVLALPLPWRESSGAAVFLGQTDPMAVGQ